MPYASNKDLPDSVTGSVKSENGRDIMRNVINSQLEAGKSETVAFASAWAALQRAGYDQNDDGEWIRKRMINAEADMPLQVRAKILCKKGRAMWIEAYNKSYRAGATQETAERKAWEHLEYAGYAPDDDGVWLPFGSVDNDADKTLSLGDVHVPSTEERGILRKFAEWIMKSDPDTPAPEKDRITGSDRNKPGSASGGRGGIDFDEKTLAALQEKADNSKYTLGQLKAVYRRGAGAYSTSHRPGVSRAAWAMARVNSFISGGHSQDNDLKKQDWVEKSYFEDVDLYDQIDIDEYVSKADDIEKAEYQGKEVELNKPFRTPGESKKFAVYVRNNKGNVVMVRFGDSEMEIKRDDPDARANFRARHNCDTAKDKTTARYWSCRFWSSKPVSELLEKSEDFNLTADILKSDEDQRLVYGWASIIYENGEPVTDSQGDIIAEDDLLEAAHNYVSQYREAKAMHEGDQIGEVVESLVFTSDVQKALGIDLGKVGWFIGMKISDDDVWQAIKENKIAAFSIGGKGRRIEIDG